MRYRLYWGQRSGAASVEFLLTQLGVDFEILDATPWNDPPGPAYAELKRVNPLAQMPTLVTPGDEVLTESVAILWTLVERHPSRWVPAPSSRARASCLRWMNFVASNVYAAVGIADYPERWIAPASAAQAGHFDARAALADGAVRRMHEYWAIVAGACPESGFFLGAEPTLLDVYLAMTSRWWKMREHLARVHPDFHALVGRVDALPEVASIWARHWDW